MHAAINTEPMVTLTAMYREVWEDGLIYNEWQYRIETLASCPKVIANVRGFASQDDALRAGQALAARKGWEIVLL